VNACALVHSLCRLRVDDDDALYIGVRSKPVILTSLPPPWQTCLQE